MPIQKITEAASNYHHLEKMTVAELLFNINKEDKKAISIPSQALIFDHSQYYVLLYKGKGQAVITPVNVLNIASDRVYLNSGVNEDDRIIGSDTLLIYDELNN